MMTFLPYSDFWLSATSLDNQRLNKQVTECMQMINALEYGKKAWTHHAVTRMWWGHLDALKLYFNTVLQEAIIRGIKRKESKYEFHNEITSPEWINDDTIFWSHRKALHAKNPIYYSDFSYTHTVKETDELITIYYSDYPTATKKQLIRPYYEYVYPLWSNITMDCERYLFKDKRYWDLNLFQRLPEGCEYNEG